MSTTQQDKPASKSRRRSRKADQQDQKPDHGQSVKLAPENEDQIGTAAAVTDAVAIGEAAPDEFASGDTSAAADQPLTGAVAAADAPSADTGALADNGPVGIQTIANAYRNYARKSLQQTGSFAEQLMGARSVDKAIEAQTEFARQAYANLVAESRNIGELYGRLASQTFMSWQRLAMRGRGK